MSDFVEIVDVGPRDGIQSQPTLLDTDTKLAFIERLIDAGVRRIEAASFVNPKRVPQMADVDELVRRLPRRDGVRFIGLVLNRRGFERAAHSGIDQINCTTVASETFCQRNQGASVGEMYAVIADIVREAQAGPVVGDIPLRVHFHDTRNTGVANVCAAVEAGVRIIDASCGGVGGCPFAPGATGNVATEDVLYVLQRMGFATGIDIAKIIATTKWLEGPLGTAMPAMVSRAGVFPPAVTA